MKSTLLVTAVAASLASVAAADSYTDASNDLFDNGFDNLDITGVSMSDDGVNLSVAVTTRGFQNWTKYMMYFNTTGAGTSSNAWSPTWPLPPVRWPALSPRAIPPPPSPASNLSPVSRSILPCSNALAT